MGHRATIYTVRVHKRNHPSETLPLGAIDDNGRYLGDFLVDDIFDPRTFSAESAVSERSVGCESCQLAGENSDEVQVILNPGERGVSAKILKPSGDVGYRQTSKDTQVLRSGSLFRLPREAHVGWWACHVNNGRSFKQLVHNNLAEAFKMTFSDDIILKIEPCVNAAALREAIEKDRLLSASLSKYERSPDIADGGQWVRSDTGLKLQLHISPERGKSLAPTLVKQALQQTR